jgi:hypothetical protein
MLSYAVTVVKIKICFAMQLLCKLYMIELKMAFVKSAYDSVLEPRRLQSYIIL